MKAATWSSWALTLAEARHRGHAIELTEDGRTRCKPTPAPELLEALRRHRDQIVAFLIDEAAHLRPKTIEPTWRALGDGWWEAPDTGHLYWSRREEPAEESIAWGSAPGDNNP